MLISPLYNFKASEIYSMLYYEVLGRRLHKVIVSCNFHTFELSIGQSCDISQFIRPRLCRKFQDIVVILPIVDYF